MKRSDTLFRQKAALLYDTGASIREMVNKTAAITKRPVIDFRNYADMGVCERVGAWVREKNTDIGAWGLFTLAQSIDNAIYFVVEAGGVWRQEEMYDYSLDELIYLHDEIEKIYKYELRKSK